MIHSLWLIPPGLAATKMIQAALHSWVLTALCPGVCQEMAQVTTGSTSACLCLLSALDKSYTQLFLRGILIGLGDGTPGYPIAGASGFREDDWCVPLSPNPLV